MQNKANKIYEEKINDWKSYHKDPKPLNDFSKKLYLEWVNSKSINVNPSAKPLELFSYSYEEENHPLAILIGYIKSFVNSLMEKDTVSDHGFMFFGPNNQLIECNGNAIFKEWVQANDIKPGTLWSRDIIGASFLSLGIKRMQPTALIGKYNYAEFLLPMDYYFAPIKSHIGEYLGAVVLVLPTGSNDSLSLNLAATLAKAAELHLFWMNSIESYTNTLYDTGTLFLSQNKGQNKIVLMNSALKQILHLPDKNYYLVNLEDVIHQNQQNKDFWSIVLNKKVVQDTQIKVSINNTLISINVCSSVFFDERISGKGMTLSITSTKRINKLVAQYAGNIARLSFDDIITQNPNMKELLNKSKLGAQTNGSILLLGESGTGKDILAQAIHNSSPRRNHPFVAVNCTAFSKELIASELFGYEEGAFTGAKHGGATGKLELAGEGTLFLDEIGDMPLDLQGLLLRVIDNKTFRKVGGNMNIQFKARIIAATNKNLYERVQQGLFREDLFYRLGIIRITIPPLRQRPEDIELLAQHFLYQISNRTGQPLVKLSDDAKELLMNYEWRGNVRELQNMLEGITSINIEKVITSDMIKRYLEISSSASSSDTIVRSPSAYLPVLDEKEEIIRALKANKNNKAKTAHYLGLSRSTLYRRMREYGII